MGRQQNQRRNNPTRAERRQDRQEKRADKRKSPNYGLAEIVPVEADSRRMKPLVPLTDRQAEVIRVVPQNTLTFVVGPPGTGKTTCPIGLAIAALLRGEIEQIILTKAEFMIDGKYYPVPGDEKAKYEHLFRPMRENFLRFISASFLEYLEKVGKVRFMVLSTVLGLTFEKAFLIFDEAQVCTPDQMKAFLTRLGKQSRVVIAGDHIDQRYMGGLNGLEDAIYRFKHNRHVGYVEFDIDDCVRDDFVKDVIKGYRMVKEPDSVPQEQQSEVGDQTELDLVVA